MGAIDRVAQEPWRPAAGNKLRVAGGATRERQGGQCRRVEAGRLNGLRTDRLRIDQRARRRRASNPKPASNSATFAGSGTADGEKSRDQSVPLSDVSV